MKYRKFIYSLVGLGVIFTIIGIIILFQLTHFQNTEVAFLDVGQGDAILISEGTHQILIDGGRNGTVLLEQLGKRMPFWDRTIDIVIATHPDGDHIDGLIDVFAHYKVQQFWHTEAKKDTTIFQKLIQDTKVEDDLEDIVAYNGLRAVLPSGAQLDIVYPVDLNVEDVDDVNDTSVTALFFVGEEIFYLGGDLSSKKENILPIDNITVLKAGHHGSKKSTSEKFLQKTSPRDVVISVGKDNHYGHPHKETLQRLQDKNVKIFRTDQQGTVVYQCNEKCKVDFK